MGPRQVRGRGIPPDLFVLNRALRHDCRLRVVVEGGIAEREWMHIPDDAPQDGQRQQ